MTFNDWHYPVTIPPIFLKNGGTDASWHNDESPKVGWGYPSFHVFIWCITDEQTNRVIESYIVQLKLYLTATQDSYDLFSTLEAAEAMAFVKQFVALQGLSFDSYEIQERPKTLQDLES